MAFKARWECNCSKCGQLIRRGDDISWIRGVKGSAYHIACGNGQSEESESTSEPTNEVQPTTSHSEADEVLRGLANALDAHLKPRAELDETKVNALIARALDGFKAPQQTINVNITRTNGEQVKIENAHVAMPKLAYLISKGHHSYLYGPPGSGKSTAAKQIAEALGRTFGYISLNPQTPDSRLLGFIDANGNYRDTVFYRLYKDGGVFCIDEMDNASASLLTCLNSCLENGHASFPCGMVQRHPEFVLVATGNTCGRGANPMFPERRPFDAAFAERFSYVEWQYDEALESAITLSINPKATTWLEWTQQTRKYCATNFPRVLITPRASFKGAEYLLDSNWTVAEIAESCVFKGIAEDQRRAILAANPLPKVGHE